MPHRSPTAAELQRAAHDAAMKIEREILSTIDEHVYTVYHPGWREELHEYMEQWGIKREREEANDYQI